MSIFSILLCIVILLGGRMSITKGRSITNPFSELNNFNIKVSPCENFYEFVCNNLKNNLEIPDHKPKVDIFSTMKDNVEKQIRSALEEEILLDEANPFKLTKMLYRSCLNEPQNTSAVILLKMLDKYGGWPILHSNWNSENFDWKNIVYKNREIGYSANYFLDLSINTDLKSNQRRVITLDVTSTALPNEYLIEGLNNKVVKAYYKYMIDIAVLLGASEQIAREELKASLDFEIELAKMSLSSEKRRNVAILYYRSTVGNLSRIHPSIPWLDYINKILNPFETIKENELVSILVPNYFHELEQLLKKTPKRVQANYAMWRLVFDSVPILNGYKIRNKHMEFLKIRTGVVKREPRWEECVNLLTEKMPLSISALYVRKYFDKKAKETVAEIVTNVRQQARKIIEELKWMDNDTRTMALNKIDAMKSIIAYPDELLDNGKLDEYYQDLRITPDNFLESMLNLTKIDVDYSVKLLRKLLNRTDWTVHARLSTLSDAYYLLNSNEIVLLAAVLQDPFFNKTRPRYINYGALGFAVAHEIMHGFDDQGHFFDNVGNVVNWWKKETENKFLDKIECIIDQYDNYTDKHVGLRLNGVTTKGENIADNGGIKVAYLAYKEWVKRNGPEPKIPGLDYTPEQMFWISAANIWCIKQRDADLENEIKTGLHSPREFRVIGAVSNMPEFATDFNCPVGSPMNPTSKCSIW